MGLMADDQRRTPLDRVLLPVDTVVQHVISGLDLNAILEQIDVNELIARVDLDAVIQRSVRGATRGTVDLARGQGARLDGWIVRLVDRILRRPAGWRPVRPSAAPTDP